MLKLNCSWFIASKIDSCIPSPHAQCCALQIDEYLYQQWQFFSVYSLEKDVKHRNFILGHLFGRSSQYQRQEFVSRGSVLCTAHNMVELVTQSRRCAWIKPHELLAVISIHCDGRDWEGCVSVWLLVCLQNRDICALCSPLACVTSFRTHPTASAPCWRHPTARLGHQRKCSLFFVCTEPLMVAGQVLSQCECRNFQCPSS